MNKPKHFLVFKILSGVFLAVTIIGAILAFQGFGNFDTNNFMTGGFMFCFGAFATAVCASIGFRPEIAKMGVRSAKYMQQQNKEDLKDIASTSADITEDAVKKTAKSWKEGFADENNEVEVGSEKEVFVGTMYCKHCGAKIDADSRFCKVCGKEQ